MNKKVIIISILGLVGIGVGAFFIFKPKSEAKDKESSTGGASGSNGNANSTTTEQVQETTKKTETSPASLSDLQAIIYLAKYTDLNSAFNGNLQLAKEHWVNLGKSEQRTIPLIKNSVSSPAQLSDEQTMIYLAKYPDLLQAFGVNFDLAKQHWVNLGKAEGRTIDTVI